MKKLSLGIATTIAALSIANIATAQDWSGFYVGGNGAVSSLNTDTGAPFTYTDTSISGGIFAGYNYMLSPNVVLGVEAEYNLNTITNSPIFPMEMSDTYGIRARAGYAMDDLMFYGAIGAELGTFSAVGGPPVSDDTIGISMAAGIEYALNDRFSLRAEYTYTDFGVAAPSVFGPGVTVTTDALRFGMAMHF